MRNAALLLALVAFCGCKPMKKSADNAAVDFTPCYTPGPPTIVYKTKGDYRNLVPVTLSEDKSRIVSYPALSDLKRGDGLSLPTVLENGYLLDNRGIGPDVAFLQMTYEEYARLPQAPDLATLFNSILDKFPLTEMCNCGVRNAIKQPTETLNKVIRAGKLRSTCKVLK